MKIEEFFFCKFRFTCILNTFSIDENFKKKKKKKKKKKGGITRIKKNTLITDHGGEMVKEKKKCMPCVVARIYIVGSGGSEKGSDGQTQLLYV